MASTRRKTTKGGRDFYEIRVSLGRGQPQFSRRWYVPKGWSQKAIDRELVKVSAEFERKCKSGEVLTKAQERENKLQALRDEAKRPTLRQYGEQVFMPTKTVTFSENSRYTYQGYLDNRIYPALGGLKMQDITSANINALIASLQTEGLAVSTVIKVYTILHSLFGMAYKDDTITRNPMDKVDRPAPRKSELKRNSPEAYTENEIRRILECLKGEPLKWQVYVSLLIETGLRRGECCALKWSSIDFKELTITISGSLSFTAKKGVYLDTPKNGLERIVDITPATAAMLRELRQAQAKQAVSKWVFTQDGSPEPMHPQSPTRYLTKFGKKYGFENMHPHKLRHSFASIAITNGADVVSISEILGHADTAITLRTYSHASKESRQRASGIFQAAIQSKKQENKEAGQG